MEGEYPFWPFSVSVKDQAEAHQAVSQLVREGADFLKVYNTLSRDAYLAIASHASHAKEARLSFVGHIPDSVAPVLAGTDSPNPYTYPVFSLHEELQLLVSAGLSPMEVLRIATLRAAEFLGVQHDFGSVEEGKVANLVLLDANPIDDIRNTQKIRADNPSWQIS